MMDVQKQYENKWLEPSQSPVLHASLHAKQSSITAAVASLNKLVCFSVC